MGYYLDGDAVLEKPQLFELLASFQRRRQHLAELTQRVRPVGIEPNVTPVFGSGTVSVKWNQRTAEVQRGAIASDGNFDDIRVALVTGIQGASQRRAPGIGIGHGFDDRVNVIGINFGLIALNVDHNVGIEGVQNFGASAGPRGVVFPGVDVFVAIGLDGLFDLVVIACDDDSADVLGFGGLLRGVDHQRFARFVKDGLLGQAGGPQPDWQDDQDPLAGNHPLMVPITSSTSRRRSRMSR